MAAPDLARQLAALTGQVKALNARMARLELLGEHLMHPHDRRLKAAADIVLAGLKTTQAGRLAAAAAPDDTPAAARALAEAAYDDTFPPLVL